MNSLREGGNEELEGLLIVGATGVARNDGYGNYDDNGPDDGEGAAAPAVDRDNAADDGSADSMNIWAVAAVAALGAMFLVVVLCTSIMYCDWRKRRDRREKKRERAAARANNASNNGNGNGNGIHFHGRNGGGKKGSVNSNDKNDEFEITSVPYDEPRQSASQRQPVALQITVPAAASGETEEINTPSPQNSANGSGGGEHANFDSIVANNGPGNSGGRGGLMNKIKSGRHNLQKRVKSKAANEQLAEVEMNNDSFAGTSPSQDYVPEVAPSIADYSVGEDTTMMLYPTINRGRTTSKDNMSDFDGYSMDGMSAIAGGEGMSAYGGSHHGENVSGMHNSKRGGSSSRDVMYSGEIPRDFDSVWGDDDQSKLTVDTSMDGGYNGAFQNRNNASSGSRMVKDANKEAYGDLTKNLDELVEHEYCEEQSSNGASSPSGVGLLVGSPQESTQSSLVGAGVNLNEFDSESETSGSQNKGAFTLELLGKGTGKGFKNSGSISQSQDDEDSILGDMYKDENSSLGLGSDTVRDSRENEHVPSSGESVDSTPSWAAPIQNAMRRSTDIFRVLSASSEEREESEKENMFSSPRNDDASTSSSPKETQEQRTKEKLLFSLSVSSDDHSVGSNRSGSSKNSTGSNNNRDSEKSSKRKETTAKSADEKALGLTNSMEEEVDEDPAAMIDNINSMLSECREILDTENV